MGKFDLHYYGSLDSLEESCYIFEEYKIDEFNLFIQCSGRFGGVAPNLIIENPALFVRDRNMFHRYVIEGIEVNTDDKGNLVIDDTMLSDICKRLQG